ncbi:MAG: hypothetical protein KZQ83_00950 [gamma proteobacterium symbiont of Taylorina sp.]|nr:hypothetical protein [gamma proteobacterium symbiont of Taylorina sp.]
MSSHLFSFIEAIYLAFLVNLPIQVIITIAQWLVMARFIAPQDKSLCDAFRCLAATYLSAFLLALPIWLFWPLANDLVLYSNRISIPAVIGELIAIPFWLKRYGYF